jgi:hypothetical protein
MVICTVRSTDAGMDELAEGSTENGDGWAVRVGSKNLELRLLVAMFAALGC